MSQQLTDIPGEDISDTDVPEAKTTSHSFEQWRKPLLLLTALLVGWVIAYWPSLVSMVDIWIINDTFTHGFFVLPISLWLIWRERSALQTVTPQPSWWVGTALVASLSALWMIAELVAIQAVQHLAIVAMLSAFVLAAMGWEVVKKIWFPLFFLLFAAPVGDFLVPPLMELTAWITVKLLVISGFPVLREGMLITIPSGAFEVEHACSGISYLIASVVLGCVYAYLSYRTLWRRGLFILLSVLVPLAANGLRAYGIVLLAHYSDYTLAVGFDHLIYGGVFFGVVMLILFWLGSFLREAPERVEPTSQNEPKSTNTISPSRHSFGSLSFGLLPLFALLMGPGANLMIFGTSMSNTLTIQEGSILPSNNGKNEKLKRLTDANFVWLPEYKGPTKAEQATYEYDSQEFSLYVASYARQTQDAELISNDNRLYDPKQWRPLTTTTRQTQQSNQPSFQYKELKLSNGHSERLIAYWYQIGERSAVNPAMVKFYDALNKFSGQKGSSIIAIAIENNNEEAPIRLERIVNELSEVIKKQLKIIYAEQKTTN